eukprot:3794696-Ditylum_brightwellii.AAC.1
MEQSRDKYYGNKGEVLRDELDFFWHSSLSADFFTIKEKIVYDAHSHQMKGFADEDWNHIDDIADALSSIATNEQNETPEAACHYYVVLFTTYLETMSALSLHGFIITAIIGDGATENQSILKADEFANDQTRSVVD